MRRIALIVILSVIASVTAAAKGAEAGQAPYTMLLVLPSAPSPETQKKAMALINAIITLAPPKTRLVVFNGPDRQRLAEADIPDAPPAGRTRLLRQPLAEVVK